MPGPIRYKKRLLEDGSKAIAELGFTGRQAETWSCWNTPAVHNSSFARCALAIRGRRWVCRRLVQVGAYRARVVIEPRKVLAEFGLDVAPDVEVRVWDFNAEIRYMVLPMRPRHRWLSEDTRRSGHARCHDRHRHPQGQGLRLPEDSLNGSMIGRMQGSGRSSARRTSRCSTRIGSGACCASQSDHCGRTIPR